MKQVDPNHTQLRQEAEAQFAHALKPRPRPPEVLLHELQVHQIELEVQNEHLRQAQVELEESRDRYVDFYDFAPVGYLTLGHGEMIAEINFTGATLLGVERSKLISRRFSFFVAMEFRDRWQRHFLSVLKHDSKLSCELVLQRSDGSRFHAQMDCLCLKKEGKEAVVRVVLTDISERILLDKARQEAHDRFEKITQLAPGIVYQFQLRPNGSTCMPYASEAFHRIFRLNPAEVRKDAAKVFNRVHPEDLEDLMASIQASARNLTPWQHEFRLKFDDGAVLWLLSHSLPQREADGSTLWYGLLTDITQRKQVERSLHGYTRELALRNRILDMIGQDAPLAEILDELAREVETLHPELRCSIMLLDEGGKRLRLGAAPSLPDAYRRGLDGLMVDDGKCACGEVVCSCMNGCCTSVGVEDIQRHGCKLGRLVGMQSCRVHPMVTGENRMLGTFTFYHPQSLPSLEAETSLLESYANLAMLAIEREQAQQVLRSEQELKANQAASRGFSRHLQTIREEEKANIAREIHDDLGGTLTAMKMEAYWLAEELPDDYKTAPLLKHVEMIGQLVDDATSVLRRIITGLRPTILDDLGLPAALEWYAAQFHERSGIECQTNCIVEDGRELDRVQSINLFRIFQEALTNILRHSHASKVEVEFCCGDGEIVLSISDNGRGMPEKRTDTPVFYGILGMTERVAQMGGEVIFGSPPDGGFSVTVSMPLSEGSKKGEEI